MTRMLDEERLAELREFFDDCDVNKDGRIQHDEFSKLLGELGTDVSAEEVAIGFAELDRDHDGTIDFGEFLSYWTER